MYQILTISKRKIIYSLLKSW